MSSAPTPGRTPHHLARCYERRTSVVEAFFDLADTVITIRSLIRRAWTTHRWDTRPRRRPWLTPTCAASNSWMPFHHAPPTSFGER